VPLAAKIFAPALIDAVTVVLAPAASGPPADDKVTHVCVFVAVQAIEAVPVFVSVYDWLDGVNGPPAVPEEVRPPAETVSGPATVAVGLLLLSPGNVSAAISAPFKNPSPSESAFSMAVKEYAAVLHAAP
jgi:hypothetical protein